MLSKRTRTHFLKAAGAYYTTIALSAQGQTYARYLSVGGVFADEERSDDVPALRKKLFGLLTDLRNGAAAEGEAPEIIDAIHFDLTRLSKLIGAGRLDRSPMREWARKRAQKESPTLLRD